LESDYESGFIPVDFIIVNELIKEKNTIVGNKEF